MSTRPIPISAGKLIADTYGYDQVVIVARKVGVNGLEHVTTYGVNKAHCDVAARMGDFFKHELMKWPVPVESQAAEIAKLTAENARLRIRGSAYEAAFGIAYQATYQSHNGHWDSTMRGGAGCRNQCAACQQPVPARHGAVREHSRHRRWLPSRWTIQRTTQPQPRYAR